MKKKKKQPATKMSKRGERKEEDRREEDREETNKDRQHELFTQQQETTMCAFDTIFRILNGNQYRVYMLETENQRQRQEIERQRKEIECYQMQELRQDQEYLQQLQEINYDNETISSLKKELEKKEEKEAEYLKQIKSLQQACRDKEVETKKFQIQLSQLQSLKDKNRDLRHKIDLLQRLVDCKDVLLTSRHQYIEYEEECGEEEKEEEQDKEDDGYVSF